MALTETTREKAREIIARYPKARSALLPMLHLVQSEEGYVTVAGVAMCAEELGLTKAEVGAVATFYTMYKRRPTGDYLVSVCTNTMCGFLGGDEIYAALSEYLGIGHDQTTGDGKITLEHAECLAACDYAPVVTVNYEFFDQQTVSSAKMLVEDLQSGHRPLPTRGAPLGTFRQIEAELAGFVDQSRVARGVEFGQPGLPTLRGLDAASDHNHEAPSFDPNTPIAAVRPKEPPPPPAPKAEEPKPEPEPTPEPKAEGTSIDRTAAVHSGDDDVPTASPDGDADPAKRPTARRTRGA